MSICAKQEEEEEEFNPEETEQKPLQKAKTLVKSKTQYLSKKTSASGQKPAGKSLMEKLEEEGRRMI